MQAENRIKQKEKFDCNKKNSELQRIKTDLDKQKELLNIIKFLLNEKES
jgi:hypothetical protein